MSTRIDERVGFLGKTRRIVRNDHHLVALDNDPESERGHSLDFDLFEWPRTQAVGTGPNAQPLIRDLYVDSETFGCVSLMLDTRFKFADDAPRVNASYRSPRMTAEERQAAADAAQSGFRLLLPKPIGIEKTRYMRRTRAVFTFQCTRCRKKPAIITRGRRVFLCPECATGSLWYDMVGSLMDPNAPSGDVPDDLELSDEQPVAWAEGPVDPWQSSA